MTTRIPKYRKHKPSDQALVEIRGQRIYLGKHNSPESKERNHRIICDLLSPGTQRVSEEASTPLTVNELVLGY